MPAGNVRKPALKWHKLPSPWLHIRTEKENNNSGAVDMYLNLYKQSLYYQSARLKTEPMLRLII
jgi:hypothetical protein